VGQNSTSQSYTVSGSNLTANIAIQAPTGFQVSLSSTSGFASSLNLTQSGGTVSNTTIYARFSPTSAGFQSGNISHTSTGATIVNISISGAGIQSTTGGVWDVVGTITLSGTDYVRHIAISGGKAYVTRSGANMTIIDLNSVTELAPVSFSTYPSCSQGYVAVSGNRAYVALSNLGSNGQLAVVNIDNNSVLTYIPVGVDPWGVTTYSNQIYVANNNHWTNGDPATVRVIDMNTNSVVDTILVGINPNCIAIDPTTGRAFVTNGNSLSNSVSVINTATNNVIATISVPNQPFGVAISANCAYVSNYVDSPNGTVEVIDISSNTIIASIPVGRDAIGVAAISGYVFVANSSSNTVSVIDVTSNTVVTTINVGNGPDGIAVDQTTNKVYVTNQNDKTISIIGRSVTSVKQISQLMPDHFALSQNYPNPMNPSTTISFNLPVKSFVSLKVFDMLGREVASIISQELPAGTYARQWNAGKMSSGVYFYRLQAGSFTQTKRLVLLK
jgi:YVTN family beta-propeller protein